MTGGEYSSLLERVEVLEGTVRAVANDRLLDREDVKKALEAVKALSAAVTLLLHERYKEPL